ncbi:MAG: prepilin peptidase [Candidatus Diapherotrites archaeon]|nr:prepilin peptidase [Candidatus Diapherotrites archaeon]
MYAYLTLFLTTIYLAAASYSDIKTRFVKNKLTYSMTALGFLIHATQSILESNPQPLMFSIAAATTAYVFVYFLWRLGVFAGGDAKLIVGIAAMLPTHPFSAYPSLTNPLLEITTATAYPLFWATVTAMSFISIAPFILIYCAYHSIRLKKTGLHMLSKKPFLDAMLLTGWTTISFLSNLPWFIVIPGIFAVFAANSKIKTPVLPIVLISTGLFLALELTVQVLAPTIFLLYTFDLGKKFYKTTSKHVLSQEKKISELEEGDIISEEVFFEDNRLVKRKHDFFEPIKLLLSNNKEKLAKLNSRQWIANPKRAAGLTEEELAKLNELSKKGLINSLTVKKSVPFTPAIFIGFLLSMIIGDFLWLVIK